MFVALLTLYYVFLRIKKRNSGSKVWLTRQFEWGLLKSFYKYVRELIDIWNYRSQIDNETKRKICPPHGDPIRHFNMTYIHTEANLHNVKKVILEVMEKMR